MGLKIIVREPELLLSKLSDGAVWIGTWQFGLRLEPGALARKKSPGSAEHWGFWGSLPPCLPP